MEALEAGVGFYWIGTKEIFVSPRPALYVDDRNRPHRADGAAVEWVSPGGDRYWFWHGVRVAQHVIEAPEKITVKEIDGERNAEVRRVLVERYGAARYLMDSGALKLQRDRFGVLYRKEIPEDEPLVMVRVLNSTPEPDGTLSEIEAREAFGDEVVDRNLSTMDRIGYVAHGNTPRFKEYFLRVPPTMRTAHEAVAWTFGLTPEQYSPAIET